MGNKVGIDECPCCGEKFAPSTKKTDVNFQLIWQATHHIDQCLSNPEILEARKKQNEENKFEEESKKDGNVSMTFK